jgi:hypothetical protein
MALQGDALKREMEQRSHDVIRVHNPLTEDFRFMYDRVWWKVNAGADKDMERFLARKFFTDISQLIVGQMIAKKGEDMLDKRAREGKEQIYDKYIENKEIWDKMPRMDNKELLQKVMDDCILGVVERYGSDAGPEEEVVKAKDPTKTIMDEVIDEGFSKALQEKTAAPTKPIIEPISSKESIKKEATIE